MRHRRMYYRIMVITDCDFVETAEDLILAVESRYGYWIQGNRVILGRFVNTNRKFSTVKHFDNFKSALRVYNNSPKEAHLILERYDSVKHRSRYWERG